MPHPSPPPHLSKEQWVHLVLHAAQAVLAARNQAKPPGQRILAVLVPLDCMTSAVPATVRSVREAFLGALAACRAHLCIGADSEALFDAAAGHLRCDKQLLTDVEEQGGALCALSHTAERDRLYAVTLFGYSRAAEGNATGTGRTEFRGVVHRDWVPFVQALGFVCNALDRVLQELVSEQMLPNHAITTWPRPHPPVFDDLPAPVRELRSQLNDAWAYVFEMVFECDFPANSQANPPPSSSSPSSS